MASLALGNPGATFPREVDVAVDQVVETRTDRPTRRSRRRGFRKDIEGLRAVAILAVVLYHAHVGAVPGGYVGVDVFFVISGYLITGHLWREVRERRALSFSGFYGRRIRRLLPASFLVLAVTAIASAVILPPLTARSVLKDGLACALYVGNYRFAFVSTNYLTASAPPSPFQQYWSLGVEEQFYLIWPAVLLCASMAWRRRPSRTAAVAVLGVIAVSSSAFSVWLTNANQPWAFFSLPTPRVGAGRGRTGSAVRPRARAAPGPAAGGLDRAGARRLGRLHLHLHHGLPGHGGARARPRRGSHHRRRVR